MSFLPTQTPLGVIAFALSFAVVSETACASRSHQPTLPAALSDEEFWRLSAALSEPAGAFTHSDNLVSNEALFVHTIRLLRPREGVYIGVGPEQNFSYIATLRPALAFLIDIRAENRNLHLLYKALFETSVDRAEFTARLFSRERPSRLDPRASVHELFTAFENAAPSRALYEATARLVRGRLVDVHRFPLTAEDLLWIEFALNAFYTDGPSIHYARARPGSAPGPSYQSLMTATDFRGQSRSYLATHESYAFLKDLQVRNLIVPVVGNFGGADAIMRVADYIRQTGSVVSAFYSSNVEVYLMREELARFCRNLAALPSDSNTWFIGSKDLQPLSSKLKSCLRN